MQLHQVDIVGAEAAQRIVDALDQPGARGAGIIRAIAHRQRHLGGDQHIVAPSLDGRAEHFFGGAVGVDIGRIEQIDAGLDADVDETACLDIVAVAPGAEKRPLATERAGAETQRGNLQS
ncbi:hypothetical protein D3C72_1713110 [compost metagenome]